MAKTGIDYLEYVWNPITGCTRESAGCGNCWARELHNFRMRGHLAGKEVPEQYRRPFGVVQFHPERVYDPMHWRKPRIVGVCFGGDLFHQHVRRAWLHVLFGMMEGHARHHTYLLLTKRVPLMHVYLMHRWGSTASPRWHIWAGCSVEDQACADQRRPLMEELAAMGCRTWVSSGPRLTAIDWSGWEFIEWMVTEGESGRRARPMLPDWPRSDRDWCQQHGIPFYFKQWGEWCHVDQMPEATYVRVDTAENLAAHGQSMWRVGKKAAGRLLDGRTWDETPWSEPKRMFAPVGADADAQSGPNCW